MARVENRERWREILRGYSYLCLFLLWGSLLCLMQCGERAPVPAPEAGPVFVALGAEGLPAFRDDFPHENLLRAIDYQLQWLDRQEAVPAITLAGRVLDGAAQRRTLTLFREIWLEHAGAPEALRAAVAQNFLVYRVLWDGSPDVLFTGYHAPVYRGSRVPDARYRFPLYRMPEDAVTIRPSLFDPKMLRPGTAIRHDRVVGRIDRASGEVVPYHTRAEIDGQGALAGRGLELVYLESYFEAFMFQVQGGGFVQLEDGRYLRLNYAGKNSHPYASIGRLLVDEGKIPEEEISVQAIEAYFAEFPEEITRVCYLNPSYVFYQAEGEPVDALQPEHFPHGVLGFPVTTLRSIATDKRYFPGGGLFFLEGMQRTTDGEPQPFSGFAVDQDTGGAIKEAHIDLFQGAGPEAEARAGLLKDESGRLYLLVARQEFSN